MLPEAFDQFLREKDLFSQLTRPKAWQLAAEICQEQAEAEAEAEAEADDALGLGVGGMHLPLRLVGGKWVLMPAS